MKSSTNFLDLGLGLSSRPHRNKNPDNMRTAHNMKLTKTDIQKLSPHLFWDVDLNDLHLEKHSDFLIKRILEYGKISDFRLLKNRLGVQEIAEAAKKMRNLDEVTLHFIAAISNTNVKEYRCYTPKQSQKNYIDF